MSNTFGRIFRLTTFGESHGPAIGGVIDGCPAGVSIDAGAVQAELDRRRPGTGLPAASPRQEADKIHFLSGLLNGITLGTPIAFMIENQGQNHHDYEHLRDIFRPGHADFTCTAKYGLRDWRGGGRASGRETASRVAGGAIAQSFLKSQGINIRACAVELGGISADAPDFEGAELRPYFAADDESAAKWDKLCSELREAGDSAGGVVLLEARGLPAGLGEPVFDRLDARIGAAMLGVGGVKGVETGSGFAGAAMRGSAHNDIMRPCANDAECIQTPSGEKISFDSNNAGGVLGGISTGQPLLVRVAVKPASSIARPQPGVNSSGEAVTINTGGRHDVCLIPRIIPVLKAMLALALADFTLLARCSRVE